MAANNTAATLNGLFKEVYADKLENLIPDGVKLLTKIPFAKKTQMTGNLYHQPVVLGHEHGITFAASTEDAFTLNPPIAGQIKDAQVQGNALVLRSAIGYKAASASMTSAAAFEQATKFLVGNMLRSVTKKLEIEMLYGQVGYGVVGSVTGAVISIPASEWAPGIWAGAEQMPIEVRSASGGTSRGTATIVAVSFENKTITVDALPAGTVATDVIWHLGAYGKEFAGLHKIITNTGVLFGIDASQYTLFKGNTYDAGGAALSFMKVQEAIAKAVEKGLDNDVMVLVNPRTWADMLSDQAALRQYDSSYSSSKMENGSRELQFHGQNGMISIVPSIYCKQGYAYVLSTDDMVRIGSSEVTFKRPGKEGDFFRELENAAGYELRCYCDMSLFTHSPAKNVLIQNIV
jgi:hypothetical protein